MSSTESTDTLPMERLFHVSTSVLMRFRFLSRPRYLSAESRLRLHTIMPSATHQETPCTDLVSPTTTSPSSRISRYGRRQSFSSAPRHPTCSIIPVQPTRTLQTVAAIQLLTRHP